MRLKYLELYGFKSFAEKTKLDFNSDFIGIVGPNGSGKSNVSDAIRWVLGEQSAKALRGANMADVIFAGNKKKNPMNMAEVTIVFDNTDASIDLPFEEVSISRRVYRSGESEYRINREVVRRRDIRDLFLDTGVGKEGYSIISQGRIDDILSSNSEDRRQLFEEAARISKYKQKKSDALNCLEKTADKLETFEKEVELKAKEEKLLAQQAENAREGMRLTQKLNQAELSLIHEKLLSLDTTLQNHQAALEKDRGDANELAQEMEKVEQKLAPHRQELDAYELRRSQHLEQKTQLERKIADSENRLSVLQEQNKFYKENQSRLHKEASQLEERLKGLQRDQEEAEEASSRLEQKQRALQERQAALNQEKKSSYTSLQEKLKELAAQREKLTARLAYLDFSKQSSEQEQAEWSREKANKEADLQQATNDLAEKKQKLQAVEEGTEGKQKDLDALKDEQRHLQAQESDLLQQIEEKQKDLAVKKGKREGLYSRWKVLDELARSYEGYGYAVQQLLRQSSTNAQLASHMKGTLADLIRVKSGYEKAIHAVLGGSLQNIVTESQEDAKFLIGWLKERKLGRVTFLPIRSIRGERPVYTQAPEEICNGVEAVDYPKELEGIISHFLARTTIVADLDQAIALSRKGCRNRIVSLDGEIINSWGSMVGGRFKERQGSQLLNRQENLDQIQKQIQTLEEEVQKEEEQVQSLDKRKGQVLQKQDQLREKENHLLAAVSQDRERIAELRAEIRLESQALLDLKTSLTEEKTFDPSAYEEEKQSLNKELGALDQRQTECNKQLKAEEASYNEAEKERALLENQLEYNQRELNIAINRKAELVERLSADQEKLKVTKDEEEKTSDQLEKNILEEADKTKKISIWQKELKEAEDRNQQDEQAHQQWETEAKALSQQRETLEQEKDQLDRSIYALKLRLEGTEEKRQELIEDYCSRYDLSLEDFQLRLKQLIPIRTSRKEVAAIQQALSQIGFFRYEAIEEHRALEEELTFLRGQIQDLTVSKANIESMIRDLDRTMEMMFTDSFKQINKAFNEIFMTLFNGGQASLSLDSDDPLSAGIEIEAQPPGKKLQSLDLLSGGERSMTALALLFAIFSIHPTPFCILDEIDASLDEANISRYVRYLQTLKAQTQFIVITHRKTTMELADMIYGLTMEDGQSKIYSLRFEDYPLVDEEAVQTS